MAEGFVGGGSAYNILTQPPQVTALTLTAGNAKIDGSFRTVDAAYAGLAHDYWIVRQAGRIPKSSVSPLKREVNTVSSRKKRVYP